MPNTNADGSAATSSGWFDSLLGGLGKAATVAAGWKELVDPVRSVQSPNLGMGANSPTIITGASGGQASLNKQVLPGNATTLWYVAGGLVILLLVVVLRRK